jgi:hypothetical protein
MQTFLTHLAAVWLGLGLILTYWKINEHFEFFDDTGAFGLILYVSIASILTGLVAWAFL